MFVLRRSGERLFQLTAPKNATLLERDITECDHFRGLGPIIVLDNMCNANFNMQLNVFSQI